MPTEPVDIDDQYSNNSVDNWSDTQNRSSSKDDEDKDYKRLLISLGMVLPAIAAIIGTLTVEFISLILLQMFTQVTKLCLTFLENILCK